MDPDAFRNRRLFHGFDGIVHDLVQIQGLHFQMNLARDDPTHVEQVVHDLSLNMHVALDRLESTLEVLGFRLAGM